MELKELEPGKTHRQSTGAPKRSASCLRIRCDLRCHTDGTMLRSAFALRLTLYSNYSNSFDPLLLPSLICHLPKSLETIYGIRQSNSFPHFAWLILWTGWNHKQSTSCIDDEGPTWQHRFCIPNTFSICRPVISAREGMSMLAFDPWKKVLLPSGARVADSILSTGPVIYLEPQRYSCAPSRILRTISSFCQPAACKSTRQS
jgi:hypothetical protein